MGWIYLALAILFEISGTTCMKLSMGFTKTLPSVLMFVFYFLSFIPMTVSLKTIDVSIAYAVWSGVGTALITIIGIVEFKEPISTLKIVSIALIIFGVVGLHLSGQHMS